MSIRMKIPVTSLCYDNEQQVNCNKYTRTTSSRSKRKEKRGCHVSCLWADQQPAQAPDMKNFSRLNLAQFSFSPATGN